MSMTSPALSSGSQTVSPNPFDKYQEGLRNGNTFGSSPTSPVQHHSPLISPPPANNGDSNLARHQLEAVIPESPIEEEEKSDEHAVHRPSTQTRQSSLQQPSLLSQGAPTARTRTPSQSSVHLQDAATTAPKHKKGLLRKLSGINSFFHHESKNHASSTTDLKTAKAGMHNTELKHPHTGTVSKPTDSMPISPTARRAPQRPTFAVGDSPSGSPNTSARPSRTPSINAFPSSTIEKTSSPTNGPPVSSSSSQSNASPRKTDHEDFIPKQPTRANSTFNFFRKNNSVPEDRPPPRAASFTHGESMPMAIPGTNRENSADTPMASLSRTLSKASLVGGTGWGNLTDKLPSFDTLYTYKDANEKKIKLDMHGKLGQIGEGAGGVIRTARLRPGKHPAYNPLSTGGNLGLFAVKTFRKQSERESEGWYCQKLVREFRVHSALSHVNIVKLADICVEQKKFGEPAFVAVLDFCVGGDVFDLHYHAWNAIDQGVMSKVERNCVFKQLMFAVTYMHQQGIAHRDIKLENLLIDGHGQVKLADFGTSNFIRGTDAEPCRGYVGTEHSMAPETFLSDLSTQDPKPEYDGTKADIWACAVAWHILTWSNDEPTAVYRAYPFGEDGASPDNKQWQKYMNSIKRYEPERYIPGWELYMERKAEKNHTGTPPGTPGIDRKDSMAMSATSGASGRSMMEQMFDTTDPTPNAHPHGNTNDLRDPLRKCKPFLNGYPDSGFTAAKGMLDPDPDSRWSAQQVINDPFFALIECCQKDSNSQGYDHSRDKHRKGLQKVHNHIRPAARKLMEMNKVEQARNEEKTAAIRCHKDD